MFYSKQPEFKKKMGEIALKLAIEHEDAIGKLLETN